ncbi:hypothetical protein NPIL_274791 [Nephila pilipes]|uniref:Uncharacterized protein n=1 Tax=Nephila pilipes TaxID=299642 RepID=A0A8X6Q3I7_NEPPI|nr:hypothetical protein NPIL_274791 [Nephila pilipes]
MVVIADSLLRAKISDMNTLRGNLRRCSGTNGRKLVCEELDTCELSGTPRTVADARLWQVCGGEVHDVGTGPVAMRQDEAQNGIQREESQLVGSIWRTLMAPFSVKGSLGQEV